MSRADFQLQKQKGTPTRTNYN